MRSTRKALAVVGAIGVGAFALSGCSGGSGSGDDSTIEFQTALGSDSALYKALEDVVGEFEDQNSGVDIDLVPQTTSYEADMKVRLASGDIPDIFGTHGWSLLRYSEFLEPLQDESWAADVNPALDSAMRGDGGEIYAFPIDTDVAGIIVNNDVLAKVGASAEDIDSWDDFTAVAKKVAAAGIAPITVSGKDGTAGNLVDWIAADAFSQEELDGLSNGTFAEDSYERIVDLVSSWQQDGLFNPDYSSATSDDMSQALADADTAFVFSQNRTATDALSYNEDANIGYMPIPSLLGNDRVLVGGEMNAYGIAKDGPHADVAKRLFDFFAQPENLEKLASAAGNIPGLTTAEPDLGALTESYDAFVASNEYTLKPYFDRVYLPNGMWDTLVTTTDALVTGQSTPAQATEQVATDFKSLYGQSE